MTNLEHQQLKEVIHIDLAAILFGMVKSKKYSENDIMDMHSFIAVRFANVAKSDSYLVDSSDLEIILENTFDFAKNFSDGVIDTNMRRRVTTKYYELLKVNPELIEKHIESILTSVMPYIK